MDLKKKFYGKEHDLLAGEGEPMEDWLYLIHHVHTDEETGKEVLHHCQLLDHLGNKYDIKHIVGKDSRYYHAIVGLSPDQRVYWGDEDARTFGEKVPCANRQLEKPA